MTTPNETSNRNTVALVVLTLLMFLWGLANNMTGTMLQNFRHIINMDDIQESIIKSAFHAAYLFAALPAVIYLYKKLSYRTTILLGLMLFALGSMFFFPAASMESYMMYLIAIYVMATGCTVLETVANTYIVASAPTHDRGVFRLNLAQSFNPLGSILGILLCQYIMTDNAIYNADVADNPEIIREELDSITILYAGLGEFLLVLLVMVMFVSIPTIENVMIGHKLKNLRDSIRRLFHIHDFRRGVITIFIYVGAQIGVWRFIIPTVIEQGDDYNPAFFYSCAMIGFAVSRFVFTWMMKHFSYRKILLWTSIIAALLTLAVILGDGAVVVVSIIGISCCMAPMFPTIFGMALENTGRDTQTGGAILVMMVVGGSVLFAIQNILAAKLSAQMSYILPEVCFLCIVAYATFALLLSDKKSTA
ncbi:MAG: L-fucose:H+ symporter permease [Bacteroidales bacterium]|nr:L-fucose:H+ symporter permease [Bacteroidales bacterium]